MKKHHIESFLNNTIERKEKHQLKQLQQKLKDS